MAELPADCSAMNNEDRERLKRWRNSLSVPRHEGEVQDGWADSLLLESILESPEDHPEQEGDG